MFLDGGLALSAHAESHEENIGRERAGKRGEYGSLKVTPQIAWLILEAQPGFLGLLSQATERQGSRLEHRCPPQTHNNLLDNRTSPPPEGEEWNNLEYRSQGLMVSSCTSTDLQGSPPMKRTFRCRLSGGDTAFINP
ncbi:hypothetical protein SRHO_G00084130 [Serrasalmus rhombeus]